MNILVVSQRFYPDTIGGSERVVFEQGRELVRSGHRVVLICPRVRTALAVRETVAGMEVWRYGSPFAMRLVGKSQTDRSAGKACISGRLKEESFDVAVLHHPFIASAFFALQPAIPSVYVFHASVWRELQLDRTYGGIAQSVGGRLAGIFFTPAFLTRVKSVESVALKRANTIAVFSEFSRLILKETYRVADSRVVQIPGGVDLETYRPQAHPDALRALHGLPRGAPLAFTVRRLVPRMGVPLLVRAWKRVVAEVPNAFLGIGGDGPEAPRIHAEIKKQALDANIRLLGLIPIKDLADYYAAADLSVLPTIAFEGYGLTVLESLASGTPVVATPAGAIAELLEPFDSSLLARDVSESALADAIIGFFRRDDRGELRARARAYAERFPWSRSALALERLLVRPR